MVSWRDRILRGPVLEVHSCRAPDYPLGVRSIVYARSEWLPADSPSDRHWNAPSRPRHARAGARRDRRPPENGHPVVRMEIKNDRAVRARARRGRAANLATVTHASAGRAGDRREASALDSIRFPYMCAWRALRPPISKIFFRRGRDVAELACPEVHRKGRFPRWIGIGRGG